MKLKWRKPEDHLPMPERPPMITIARVELYDPEGNKLFVHRDYRTLMKGETYMFQVTFDDDSPASDG